MRLQQIFSNLKKTPEDERLINHFNNGIKVLGLNPKFKEKELTLDNEYIENMIARRLEAKKNKDFIMADQIRDDLHNEGVLLEDSKTGTTWKKV